MKDKGGRKTKAEIERKTAGLLCSSFILHPSSFGGSPSLARAGPARLRRGATGRGRRVGLRLLGFRPGGGVSVLPCRGRVGATLALFVVFFVFLLAVQHEGLLADAGAFDDGHRVPL